MTKGIHIACTKKLDEALKQRAQDKSIVIEDADIIETGSSIDDSIIQYTTNPGYTYIFTSGKAVKYFVEYHKNNLHEITNKCFAINGLTAQSLSNTSMHIVDTAPDAATLAEKIIQHRHELMVHFTAMDHRMELYETLGKSNIQCETCIVYNKKSVPREFEARDAVLFFSPSQVDAFLICNSRALNIPVFCIGYTTAKHVETKGFQNIITSQEPSQEALLEQVYQYFKT